MFFVLVPFFKKHPMTKLRDATPKSRNITREKISVLQVIMLIKHFIAVY